MSEAQYSVIRYIPDPGRGERLNVGILVWGDDAYRLRLDDRAIERVVRENPLLERDALLYVAPMLTDALEATGGPASAAVEELLAAQKGFPIDLSEPRLTAVADGSGEALEATLQALTERVVRPRRRAGGGSSPIDQVERKLAPLVKQGAVSRNHFFAATRTGVTRTVDFFANANVNTALDVVQLELKRADEIRHRADAEAFKVFDLKDRNDVRFVVYCVFSDERGLRETNQNARQIIESIGAQVVTGLDEAANAIRGD
jgi:Protein of unknown function (DUF3037)